MRSIILILLLSLFILMFCFTEFTLRYFLPLAATNWEVFLTYYNLKDAIYDLMFFITSILVFSLATNLLKALAAFALILTGGSFIDKVIFGINSYLISDVILILIGVGILFMYFKKQNGRIKNLGN